MFCVLSVERKKLTLLEKIFKFLVHDEYSIKTIPVFKGAPFYVLEVKVSGDVDWYKIIENAGKCSKRLIVSGDIEIPDLNDLGVFKSSVLYNKVFQSTLLEILKNNKSPQYISVLDKNAKNIDFVFKLSQYASRLTVVTENKQKYLNVCDKILNDTGLCISLHSNFDNARIKIDTGRNIMSIENKNEFLNISNGENILVNDVYKKLLPKGINEQDFYSALYEFCGVFSLGECIFETVCVNNEKKLIKDIQFAWHNGNFLI